MKSERSKHFSEAMRFLDAGLGQETIALGKRLLESKDEAFQLSGHLCLGLAYEEGGHDLETDLDKAIYHYHHAALISQSPVAFTYLARATMKKGETSYPSAYKYLIEAQHLGNTCEALLGFAHYYRTKANKDVDLSRKYYFKAAMRGRFAGFFGYSSLCKEIGQNGRAFAMATARVVAGPFLYLFLGDSTQERF